MNTYSNNLLKQFTIKRGLLHYISGPFAKRVAGHVRPNGVRYVRFNGLVYKHDDLLFIYNEQLASKHLEQINTSTPQDYQTVSGHGVNFYTKEWDLNAPPYVIHGAVRINSQWHACQWTNKGEAPNTEHNLEKV